MSKLEEQAHRRSATVALEARVDIRTLAELTQFWRSRHEPLPTRSWLIRLSLESLVDILKQNGLIAEYVEKVEDALIILESAGFGDLRKHRGGRRLQVMVEQEYGFEDTTRTPASAKPHGFTVEDGIRAMREMGLEPLVASQPVEHVETFEEKRTRILEEDRRRFRQFNEELNKPPSRDPNSDQNGPSGVSD